MPDCPRCGATGENPCTSLGGYAPVGELPGDPMRKPHRDRRRKFTVREGVHPDAVEINKFIEEGFTT